MCGISGVIYYDPARYSQLGSTLLKLIQPLESRGPDSCGVAFYGPDVKPSQIKLNLWGESVDWLALLTWLPYPTAQAVPLHNGYQLVLEQLPDQKIHWQQLRQGLRQQFPTVRVMSLGQALEVYKQVGSVTDLEQHYSLNLFYGSHGIGHTRMATESVVDLHHCHPFTSGPDLTIVHNGQISNYYRLRFQLERQGAIFETNNDSEAIAHYIHGQLSQGHSLQTALEQLLQDIDGTYTFLVATQHQMALVRDRFAAKPAVIYETPEMVAVASEYRALLSLPGFDPGATIREPDAGEINLWSTLTPLARVGEPVAA